MVINPTVCFTGRNKEKSGRVAGNTKHEHVAVCFTSLLPSPDMEGQSGKEQNQGLKLGTGGLSVSFNLNLGGTRWDFAFLLTNPCRYMCVCALPIR